MKIKLHDSDWRIFSAEDYGLEVEVPQRLISRYLDCLSMLEGMLEELAPYYAAAEAAARKERERCDAEFIGPRKPSALAHGFGGYLSTNVIETITRNDDGTMTVNRD